MGLKIGIDVGGTFTDFIVAGHGAAASIHKVLSTPEDPSIAVIEGLQQFAAQLGAPGRLRRVHRLDRYHRPRYDRCDQCNAHPHRRALALLTTRGVRDALEMRRGICERQYDNRYTNVTPLVPRYLRIGVGGRLDRNGREIEPLSTDDISRAITLFKQEKVEAVDLLHERFRRCGARAGGGRAGAARAPRCLSDGIDRSVAVDPFLRACEHDRAQFLCRAQVNRYLDRLVTRLQGAGFRGSS